MPSVPSRLWYLAALIIFVFGVGAAVFFAISRIGDLQDQLTRVVVPGENVLDLEGAGTYTIFHEESGTMDGVVYSAADISGLRVTLESADTGETIELTRPTANTSYDLGGSSAVGILSFAIDTPGQYRLTAAYDDGRAKPRAILSVSHGFMGKLIGAILGTVGLALGATIVAVIIAVVTFIRRRKALAANASAPPA